MRDVIDNKSYKWIKVSEPESTWVDNAADLFSGDRDVFFTKINKATAASQHTYTPPQGRSPCACCPSPCAT
jgi:hypothetical protein